MILGRAHIDTDWFIRRHRAARTGKEWKSLLVEFFPTQAELGWAPFVRADAQFHRRSLGFARADMHLVCGGSVRNLRGRVSLS